MPDLKRGGLSRRDILLMLGASLLAGRAASQPAGRPPACVVTPEQTEGPYFSDVRLNRSDIRSDPADGSVRRGIPLAMVLRVHAVEGGRCTPLAGAVVDVWHCDAAGVYSDAVDDGADTRGSRFLRGYQVTDADGVARFMSIYPGAYPGRAVHVHFKVRSRGRSGRDMTFTSQLYFPDDINQRVLASSPYARPGRRVPRNDGDGLFRRGGRQLTMGVTGSPGGGYAAAFDIGLAV